MADFNKAIQLNPQDADAYYNRSNIYCKLNNIAQCKKDLEISMTLYKKQNNIQMLQKIRGILQQH